MSDWEPTSEPPRVDATEEIVKRRGQCVAPRHVGCPARPIGDEPASCYLRRERITTTGQSDNVWVCEGCGIAIENRVAIVEVECSMGELAARATLAMSRPEATLGPLALVYDPRAEAFLIASTGRLVQRIGAELIASTPDPDEPITKWGLATHPASPLALAERMAVAAFMAGRWFAWAMSSAHDRAIRPAGPRIVRPH